MYNVTQRLQQLDVEEPPMYQRWIQQIYLLIVHNSMYIRNVLMKIQIKMSVNGHIRRVNLTL